MLRFLYGGSSIHWPPKPILSPFIFPYLFPFKFFPSIFIYIFIFIYLLFSPTYFFVIKKFFLFPIISNYIQFGKKFFSSNYLPAQIPRIFYHRPFKNPFILSLNKYPLSRIILEILLQNHRPNYFPELLKLPLDNIGFLCYNIAREPV